MRRFLTISTLLTACSAQNETAEATQIDDERSYGHNHLYDHGHDHNGHYDPDHHHSSYHSHENHYNHDQYGHGYHGHHHSHSHHDTYQGGNYGYNHHHMSLKEIHEHNAKLNELQTSHHHKQNIQTSYNNKEVNDKLNSLQTSTATNGGNGNHQEQYDNQAVNDYLNSMQASTSQDHYHGETNEDHHHDHYYNEQHHHNYNNHHQGQYGQGHHHHGQYNQNHHHHNTNQKPNKPVVTTMRPMITKPPTRPPTPSPTFETATQLMDKPVMVEAVPGRCPSQWGVNSMAPIGSSVNDALHDHDMCEAKFLKSCTSRAFSKAAASHCRRRDLTAAFDAITEEISRQAVVGAGDRHCVFRLDLAPCSDMNFFGLQKYSDFTKKLAFLANGLYARCGKDALEKSLAPKIANMRSIENSC